MRILQINMRMPQIRIMRIAVELLIRIIRNL